MQTDVPFFSCISSVLTNDGKVQIGEFSPGLHSIFQITLSLASFLTPLLSFSKHIDYLKKKISAKLDIFEIDLDTVSLLEELIQF